jgi:hypothetical protein
MQAMSDEQQLERLEEQVDDGFAENRAEFRAVRAEFRAEIGNVRFELGAVNRSIQAMWLTIILGFAAIIVQQHI